MSKDTGTYANRTNAPPRVIAAATRDIRHQALLALFERLDEIVLTAALDTCQSAHGAAEWLVGRAFGLGG